MPKYKTNNTKMVQGRLTMEQEAEMYELGLKTPQEYFAYKMKPLDKEGFNNLSEKIKSNNELMHSSSNMTDTKELVRVTKMESALELLKKENEELKKQGLAGLGEVPMLIQQGIEKHIKETEHNNLVLENGKMKLALEKQEFEFSKVNEELHGLREKVKIVEMAKEFAPHIGGLAKMLGSGAKAMKTSGGGFAEFLNGMGEVGESSGTQLSEQDKLSLDLGTSIYSMFEPKESEQIIAMIAMVGERKDLMQVFMKSIFDTVQSNPLD